MTSSLGVYHPSLSHDANLRLLSQVPLFSASTANHTLALVSNSTPPSPSIDPPQQVDEKLGRINMSLLPYGQGETARAAPVAAIKDVSHLSGADPKEFRKGTVSAVADYGLFVNIEGVDGLLHISKMR